MGYDTETRHVRNDKETGAIAVGEINPAGVVKITTMLKPDEGRATMTEKTQKTWIVDGYVWLQCPVCGHDVMDYDICDTCKWQNTGETNIDGGPNKMTLEEAKIAFSEGRQII